MRSAILRNSQKYFNQEKGTVDQWIAKYKKAESNIKHDETWLTLYSFYCLFGNQDDLNAVNRLDAFNELLNRSGIHDHVKIDRINVVQVEKAIPEIVAYREYLYRCLVKGNYHLYPDRIENLLKKLRSRTASLEGNTNTDVFISANSGGKELLFFIEAKLLSDISCQIKYNPVRDQIIRNIDAGLYYAENGGISLDSFYFLLLTPKLFRVAEYGGNRKSTIDELSPNRSRLYCYKMLEYRNHEFLKRALPHRTDLKAEDWKNVADHLGWITFEDIAAMASLHGTMNASEKDHILGFYRERNLLIE